MTTGHNGVNGAHLRAFVERIEQVEAEVRELNEVKKEIYAELKGSGFDGKVVRKLVAARRIEPEKRIEEMQILQLYANAIQLDLGL